MINKTSHFLREKITLKLNDIQALVQLQNLTDFYIPWSASSLRPSALILVLNEIKINNRKIIVECGSGISTIYIAKLLKQCNYRDKKFYSIEHNENWKKIVEHEIKKNDLESFVDLIQAPLNDNSLSWNDTLWYDTKVLNEKFSEENIDLLLIDGPPAYKPEIKYSRYPAVPFFMSKLSDEYAVFLDDYDRRSEKRIIKEWSKILGIEFNNANGSRIALGVKGNNFNIC